MYNHLLDIFKYVADEGSINKASKKLFISPVSVYKEINKLEKQLGVTLFERNTRGCHLTNEGKKVYKGFLEIKEISDKVIKDINQDRVFNIYVSIMNKNNIIKDISSLNLDVKYNLVVLEDYKLNEMIDGHQIGTNFCFGINDHFKEVKYDFLKLGELSMMLNVPKCSRLAKLDKITFKDIKDEKLLFLKKGIFKSFDIFCQSLSQECEGVISKEYKFFSDPSIGKYVKEGYCFVSIGIFNVPDKSYVSIPFDCIFKIPYGLFYDKAEISKYADLD